MKHEFIDVQNIASLNEGDIIRHKLSNTSYRVVAHYGTRVTAVKTADVTNASEWQVLKDLTNVSPNKKQ